MSRDADMLVEVLDQALARLDTNINRRCRTAEETTAGTCWDLADKLDNALETMVSA